MTPEWRPPRRVQMRQLVDDCEHEVIVDQERIDGIFFGVCGLCGASMAETGDEDEAGVPGWEVAESMFVSLPGRATVHVEVAP